VWRSLAATAGAVALLLLAAVIGGPGGIKGSADRAWSSFTETKQDNVSDPARIITTNSGNRWVWWEEAVGAWSAKPLQGWGAGSFPVTHKLYRKVDIGVAQPHSVPLQFLAETGLIGALLALGALGVLLFAALDRVRELGAGRERDIAVALFAAATAWLVHGAVDWDWDIPGVTLPALIFLGLLVAIPRSRSSWPLPTEPIERPAAPRAVALAAAVLVLALAIVSAALPPWADSMADSALLVRTNADDSERERATAKAELAAKLDPTSVRPLFAAASLAEGRGRLVDARDYMLQAVDRQPYSAAAWSRLLRIAILTADRPGAKAAVGRLLQLDPLGARGFAAQLALFTVPAASSPTATGTPLSPKYAAAAAAPVPAAPGLGPAAGSPTPRAVAPATGGGTPSPGR
jgi:hypothetical protein